MATRIPKIKSFDTVISHFNKTEFDRFSPEALKWYRDYTTKNLHKVNRNSILNSGIHTITPKPGFLYAYAYDPKFKDVLPYYDQMPLILCFDITDNGWMGINVHYLPPRIRAIVFSELLKTLNNKNFDEKTKFRVNWAKLKKFASSNYLKFACKRYLTDHLMTPMCKIDPKYWEIALFLPIANFKKETSRTVWKNI